MPVPFAFSAATSAIPLSQLDTNFDTTITLGNTAIQLGNTVTTLNNMTLANVTISSGNVTITNVTVTTANVTTVNATTVIATTANVTTANVATSIVTGSETLSYGTVNGVAYLNGSKVLTTGSALTFDGTNFNVVRAAAIDQYVSLYADGTGPTLKFFGGAAGKIAGIVADAASASMYFTNDGNKPFIYAINGSEQMRLTSTGLGIGTSSPAYKLEANTTVAATSGVQDVAMLRAFSSGSTDSTFGARLLLGTENPNGNSWPAGIAAINDAGGSNLSSLGFYTATSGPTLNERMRLDSSGNLGIGTSSITYRLEVNQDQNAATYSRVRNADTGSSAYAGVMVNASGNTWAMRMGSSAANSNALQFVVDAAGTPTVRATLDTSGNLGLGVTPSAWSSSVATQVGYGAALSSRAAGSTASDVTHGAYWNGTNWLYQDSSVGAARYQMTGADAGSTHAWFVSAGGTAGNAITFTQAMTLDASGNLLVGTTNAGGASGPGVKVLPAANGTDGPQLAIVTSATTNSTASLAIYSAGAAAYRFYVTDGGTIYATSTTISAISDQRFKENIQDLDVGLDKIMALKPRKFDWKSGKGKDIKGDRGFIAQELEQVFPDLVDEWADPAPEGEQPYKSVRQDLIPVLVKAIQEQQAIIEQLKADVAALKGA